MEKNIQQVQNESLKYKLENVSDELMQAKCDQFNCERRLKEEKLLSENFKNEKEKYKNEIKSFRESYGEVMKMITEHVDKLEKDQNKNCEDYNKNFHSKALKHINLYKELKKSYFDIDNFKNTERKIDHNVINTKIKSIVKKIKFNLDEELNFIHFEEVVDTEKLLEYLNRIIMQSNDKFEKMKKVLDEFSLISEQNHNYEKELNRCQVEIEGFRKKSIAPKQPNNKCISIEKNLTSETTFLQNGENSCSAYNYINTAHSLNSSEQTKCDFKNTQALSKISQEESENNNYTNKVIYVTKDVTSTTPLVEKVVLLQNQRNMMLKILSDIQIKVQGICTKASKEELNGSMGYNLSSAQIVLFISDALQEYIKKDIQLVENDYSKTVKQYAHEESFRLHNVAFQDVQHPVCPLMEQFDMNEFSLSDKLDVVAWQRMVFSLSQVSMHLLHYYTMAQKYSAKNKANLECSLPYEELLRSTSEEANTLDITTNSETIMDDLDQSEQLKHLLSSYPQLVSAFKKHYTHLNLDQLDAEVQELIISLQAATGMLKISILSDSQNNVNNFQSLSGSCNTVMPESGFSSDSSPTHRSNENLSAKQKEQFNNLFAENEMVNKLSVQLSEAQERLASAESRLKEANKKENISTAQIKDKVRTVLAAKDCELLDRAELLARICELERVLDEFLNDRNENVECNFKIADLTLQLESADRQLKKMRKFCDDQAGERELEIEALVNEKKYLVNKLKSLENIAESNALLKSEVETLEKEVKTKADLLNDFRAINEERKNSLSEAHDKEKDAQKELFDVEAELNEKCLQVESLEIKLKSFQDLLNEKSQANQDANDKLEKLMNLKHTEIFHRSFDDYLTPEYQSEASVLRRHRSISNEFDFLRTNSEFDGPNFSKIDVTADCTHVSMIENFLIRLDKSSTGLQNLQYFSPSSSPEPANHRSKKIDLNKNLSSVRFEGINYLQDGSKSLNQLHKYKIIKEMFLKCNTTLPSSAPVESADSRLQCLSPNSLEMQLEEKFVNFEKSVESAVKLNRDLKITVEKLQDRQQELLNDKEEMLERIESKLALESALQEADALKCKLDNAIESLTKELNVSISRIEELDLRLDSSKCQISQLELQLQVSRREIKETVERTNKLEQSNAELQFENEKLKTDKMTIVNLKQLNSEIKIENDKLRNEEIRIEKERNRLQKMIDQVTREKDEFKLQATELLVKVSYLQSLIEEKRRAPLLPDEKVNKTVLLYRKQLEECSQKLNSKCRESNSLRHFVEQLQAKILCKEKEIERLFVSISKLKLEIEDEKSCKLKAKKSVDTEKRSGNNQNETGNDSERNQKCNDGKIGNDPNNENFNDDALEVQRRDASRRSECEMDLVQGIEIGILDSSSNHSCDLLNDIGDKKLQTNFNVETNNEMLNLRIVLSELQKRNNYLENELILFDDIKRSLQEKMNEVDNLEERLKNLAEDSSTKSEKIVLLQNFNENLQSKLNETEIELVNTLKIAQNLKKETVILKNKIDSVESDLKFGSELLRKCNEEMDNLKNRNSSLEGLLEEHALCNEKNIENEAIKRELKTEVESTMKRINSTSDLLKKHKINSNIMIEKLQNELKEVRLRYSKLESEQFDSKLQRKHFELQQKEYCELQEKYSHLQRKFASIDENDTVDCVNVRSDCDKLSSKESSVCSDESTSEKMRGLINKIHNEGTKILTYSEAAHTSPRSDRSQQTDDWVDEKMVQDNQKLSSFVEWLEIALTEAKERNDSLTASCMGKQRSIDELKEFVISQTSKLAEYESIIRTMDSKFNALEASRDNLLQEIAVKSKQLEEHESNVTKLTEAVADERKNFEKVSEALSNERNVLERLNNKNQQLVVELRKHLEIERERVLGLATEAIQLKHCSRSSNSSVISTPCPSLQEQTFHSDISSVRTNINDVTVSNDMVVKEKMHNLQQQLRDEKSEFLRLSETIEQIKKENELISKELDTKTKKIIELEQKVKLLQRVQTNADDNARQRVDSTSYRSSLLDDESITCMSGTAQTSMFKTSNLVQSCFILNKRFQRNSNSDNLNDTAYASKRLKLLQSENWKLNSELKELKEKNPRYKRTNFELEGRDAGSNESNFDDDMTSSLQYDTVDQVFECEYSHNNCSEWKLMKWKFKRTDSHRWALVCQKNYFLYLLKLIMKNGFYSISNHTRSNGVHAIFEINASSSLTPLSKFRSLVNVLVAVNRMKFLVRRWQPMNRVGLNVQNVPLNNNFKKQFLDLPEGRTSTPTRRHVKNADSIFNFTGLTPPTKEKSTRSCRTPRSRIESDQRKNNDLKEYIERVDNIQKYLGIFHKD